MRRIDIGGVLKAVRPTIGLLHIDVIRIASGIRERFIGYPSISGVNQKQIGYRPVVSTY